MCNPRILCSQHLSGEHNELHKFKPDFEKKKSITNRILLNQIEPRAMRNRHDLLARELDRRAKVRGSGGHKSPYIMPDLDYLNIGERNYRIRRGDALEELLNRCEECRKRFKKLMRGDPL